MTGSALDALIVAADRLGGCSVLLTEDMNDGQVIDTVTVADPFAETAFQNRGASAVGP